MPRIHRFCALILLCAALLVPLPGGAAQKPLILGVFPYLNSYLIVGKFAPMRDYLSSQLGRPVQIYTATDFRTFIERTARGEYDIVLTAPHLARLAVLESGYVAFATYKQELTSLLVTSQETPYLRTADLRGKSIAIPDRLALVTMMGKQMLQNAGLEADKDCKLVVTRSHSSAALSVLHRQQDAAIIGSNPFKQLAPEDQARLRVLATSPTMPTQYYIAHKRLGSRQIGQIQAALLQFAESTLPGQKFIVENGVQGIIKSDGEELKKVDVYVKEIKLLQKENRW